MSTARVVRFTIPEKSEERGARKSRPRLPTHEREPTFESHVNRIRGSSRYQNPLERGGMMENSLQRGYSQESAMSRGGQKKRHTSKASLFSEIVEGDSLSPEQLYEI